MEKIEHIGIAVKDLETSNAVFASLFGIGHLFQEMGQYHLLPG